MGISVPREFLRFCGTTLVKNPLQEKVGPWNPPTCCWLQPPRRTCGWQPPTMYIPDCHDNEKRRTKKNLQSHITKQKCVGWNTVKTFLPFFHSSTHKLTTCIHADIHTFIMSLADSNALTHTLGYAHTNKDKENKILIFQVFPNSKYLLNSLNCMHNASKQFQNIYVTYHSSNLKIHDKQQQKPWPCIWNTNFSRNIWEYKQKANPCNCVCEYVFM